MKICFFAKKEKRGVEKAVSYLRKFVKRKDIDVFHGNVESSIPIKALDSNYDIIISYISPWIIPKALLVKTKKWNLNFHPGPPEYPGIGCFNFAIYDDAKIFGSTAHIMEPKVDTGKIIGVEYFSMMKNETVESLSIKTYDAQLILFKKIMKYIFRHNYLPKSTREWKRKPFKRTDLEKLAKIENHMSKEEVDKRIRATYYPGKPAPFIEIFGHRFEYNPDR